MNQIQPYVPYTPVNNVQQPTVAYNNGQPGTVVATNHNGVTPIYQYPTTSLYAQPQQPNVQPQQAYVQPQTTYTIDPSKATSGVNIYIMNPSGIGGPSSNSYASANYANPVSQEKNSAPSYVNNNNNNNQPAAAAPLANSPISAPDSKDDKKNKKIVPLTDNYIKTLESYLRSGDSTVRKSAIVDIIKRFEEDPSRYDNPQLTALLNIALQDANPTNRMLAMSPITSEFAHGDDNTVKILGILQQSDKLYGQEAKMANEALLKTSQPAKINVS